MHVRAYEQRDGPALWELKERFERELGALGGEEKSTDYDGKLTAEYRERYIEWVDRCNECDPGCVLLAESEDEPSATNTENEPVTSLAGYAFVLPADLSLIWDAAVLNELYVREGDRGEGVADALLEGALDHARGQDLPLDRIVLDVDGGNDRAGAFYRRHGFSNWGEMVAREL
ncbi:GNAT family N-acetyltransferase [Halobacteriales archaeon QS_3_64_16]|nr:MAG: GNAT family N-acetyltransferase [Halobacteriales archaeon QS_3_64_16]